MHQLPLTDRLRRRIGAAVVDASFRSIARLGKLHPRARPEMHGVELLRDRSYGRAGAEEHLFDVYRPSGLSKDELAKRPLVLYVHGGGFRILSKDTHWVMGLAFARRGYVVVNVNYRLAPGHPFPSALEDLSTAYASLPRIAAEHGGDLSNLVLAGESAGANLVSSLAVAATMRRPEAYARRVFETGIVPRAVIAACGVFQVTDPGRFKRRRKLPAVVADRIEEVTDAYVGRRAHDEVPLADPLVLLESAAAFERRLPPFFLPVGTKDPLLDDTRRMHAALEARGVRSEAQYYVGELHAFHALVFRPNARACWERIYGFLDEALV